MAQIPAEPVPASSFGRPLLIVGAGVILVVFAALTFFKRVAPGDAPRNVLAAPANSDESFASVKPFELVERSGAKVTLETLRGRPWIAAFVFTRCGGPCPRISANMRRLQDRLADTDVRLVSVSVDPVHDTPAVLARYAEGLGADPERWLFLTGPHEAVRDLSFQSFLLPFERDETQPVGELVTHRTVLTVVDAAGAIRGYYEGETEAGAAQAEARARFLAGAR